jgi:hypothetical protein
MNEPSIPSRIRRGDLSFEDRFLELLAKLTRCYIFFVPGATDADFCTKVIAVVAARDNPDIDDPTEILGLLARPTNEDMPRGRVTESPLAPVVVSCAFIRRAFAAYHDGRQAQGWSLLADASYWCGVAYTEIGIEPAYQHTVEMVKKETSRENGTSGGKKAAESRQPIIDHFYFLVRTKGRATRWPSVRRAALDLKDALLDFVATQDDVRLSESQAEKTLSGWLNKMPDRDTYVVPQEERKRK